MNDKIKINLQMAGAAYPITINREDEEIVREAAKQVNIRINAYREHYQNISSERIIAMVANQFALETLQLKDRNDTEPYTANDETGNGYYYCNYCHFINLFFKVYK